MVGLCAPQTTLRYKRVSAEEPYRGRTVSSLKYFPLLGNKTPAQAVPCYALRLLLMREKKGFFGKAEQNK
jgi:hypothetical protein